MSERYDDIFQTITPSAIAIVRWREGSYEFVCTNGVSLRVQVPASGIVRLRYAPDGNFGPDFSYGLDPAFEAEKITITLNENNSEYLLESELLQVVISKIDLRVKFYDQSDRIICEDEGGFSAKRTVMKGWCDLQIAKRNPKKALYLGLGDKACGTRHSGTEAVRKAFAGAWAAVPDVQWTKGKHFVHGDFGVSEWTFEGTAADGSRIETDGVDLFTFKDGKILVKNVFRKARPNIPAAK